VGRNENSARDGQIKLAAIALLLAALGTSVLSAQTVNHVIVLVQENRTPDNLFGGDYTTLSGRGANLWQPSTLTPAPCVQNHQSYPTALVPYSMDACFDPDHDHELAWVSMYDGGNMDGACNVHVANASCVCGQNQQQCFPNYSYVSNSTGVVSPYFQIAETYGFANYMFQTSQGPSFPAHQFLFSGTSAPIYYNDPGDAMMYWQWFTAENPEENNLPTSAAGCTAPYIAVAEEVAPDGHEALGYAPLEPIGSVPGFPCYNHPTMADLLDNNMVNGQHAPISWKYYTSSGPYGLWTAPNAFQNICAPVVGGKCTGSEWTTHVSVPPGSGAQPILTDIATCNLPAVSWVVPDGNWSDHPGTPGENAGSSWVAAIVNAVGNSTCTGTDVNWSNTVILITWDDWGGWFDHVKPPAIGYPNGTGGQYVYGFRVPLLVVSAYAIPGHIDGPQSQANLQCPGQYCHDFGSILGYIEHVFSLSGGTIGPSQYPYADYFAPDGTNVGCTGCTYPLSSFFGTTPQPFVPITGAKYPPSCFLAPKSTSCFGGAFPSDPDNDGVD
jgi:phospholipase C